MAAMTIPTESENLFSPVSAEDQAPADILKNSDDVTDVLPEPSSEPAQPPKEAGATEKKPEELGKPKEDAFADARQEDSSESVSKVQPDSDGTVQLDPAEVTKVQALWEQLEDDFGWQPMADENKPRTFQELTSFMKAVIDENAKPSFAHQEVENFDKFVRAGGDPYQYMQNVGEINYDAVQLNSEYTCQQVIAEHLRMMGNDEESVKDTIDAYQKAGTTQKMANKSLTALRNFSNARKNEVIQQQQQYQQQQQAAEKKGIEDTVNVVANMNSIFGAKWGQREKLDLLDYMFQQDQQGTTGFSRDLFTDVNKAVLAAYVMKHGDAAFKGVEAKAQARAVDKFRQSIARDNVKQNVPNAKQKKAQSGVKKSFWDNI